MSANALDCGGTILTAVVEEAPRSNLALSATVLKYLVASQDTRNAGRGQMERESLQEEGKPPREKILDAWEVQYVESNSREYNISDAC